MALSNQVTEYNQPTAAPVPKVAAVGIAGAVVTALVGVLALFGVIVPDDITSQAQNAMAALIFLISFIQTVITFVAGYVKKDKQTVAVVDAINDITTKDLRG